MYDHRVYGRTRESGTCLERIRDDKHTIPVPPSFHFFGSNFLARSSFPKGNYVVEKKSNEEDYVICI